MKRTKLRVIEDDHGNTGLALVGLSSFPNGDLLAATEGLLLAHDIIEHQNGIAAIGTIADELEALGGIWQVRGQWGDMQRGRRLSRYSPEESIASDVSRMFVDYCNGADIGDCPVTRPHDDDEVFNSIIDIAKSSAMTEISYNDDWTPEQVTDKWNVYARVALARMRIGYRKCVRRFGTGTTSNTQFWAIAEALEPYMKHEAGEITLLWGNGDARVVETYDREW